VPQVGGTFGRDHIEWHAECDDAVGASPASGDFTVAVLHDDLVSEVSGRPGAGVGDQRLGGVEFQPEFIVQELRQLIFDSLGFGLGSDEPEEVVVGIA
jgi:hypothetical protein